LSSKSPFGLQFFNFAKLQLNVCVDVIYRGEEGYVAVGGGGGTWIDLSMCIVPEPAAMTLFALGTILLIFEKLNETGLNVR
jgi:hypothetical protein